jgi:hypothetical protein
VKEKTTAPFCPTTRAFACATSRSRTSTPPNPSDQDMLGLFSVESIGSKAASSAPLPTYSSQQEFNKKKRNCALQHRVSVTTNRAKSSSSVAYTSVGKASTRLCTCSAVKLRGGVSVRSSGRRQIPRASKFWLKGCPSHRNWFKIPAMPSRRTLWNVSVIESPTSRRPSCTIHQFLSKPEEFHSSRTTSASFNAPCP